MNSNCYAQRWTCWNGDSFLGLIAFSQQLTTQGIAAIEKLWGLASAASKQIPWSSHCGCPIMFPTSLDTVPGKVSNKGQVLCAVQVLLWILSACSCPSNAFWQLLAKGIVWGQNVKTWYLELESDVTCSICVADWSSDDVLCRWWWDHQVPLLQTSDVF